MTDTSAITRLKVWKRDWKEPRKCRRNRGHANGQKDAMEGRRMEREKQNKESRKNGSYGKMEDSTQKG